MFKNQKGFSVIELALLLVILGMLGGTAYYVFNSKKTSENNLKTSAESTLDKFEPFSVVAVGDISCDENDRSSLDLSKNCKDAETFQLAENLKPNAILGLGDLQYVDGTLNKFKNHYDKSWGKLKNITYPTPGNHEYVTAGGDGYYSYFADSPHAEKIKQGYYSFDAGGWHIISLNSNCDKTNDCGPESTQIKWLEADLAANKTKCTLAFWHYPRYTSGRYFSDKKYLEYTEQFWQKLADKKADIVLSGHDHLYERFTPMNGKGDKTSDGIREFVVGTGGRSLYERKTVQNNTDFITDDNYGVLNLKLSLSSYKWQFINLENKVLDSGSSNCN